MTTVSDLNLKSFDRIYPLLMQKYNTLVPDPNANILDKINSIVDYLNSLGKLSNDVVDNWNKVMAWTMADGLTTDVNNKIEAMNTSGELNSILTSLFNAEIGDLTTLTTTDKSKIVNAINEVEANTKANAAQLADIVTVDVKQKGAKGDGVTDDTLAIQTAINSISGGKVLFPSGTYKVTSTITLKPSILIEGINKDTVIINSTATGFTFGYQTANGSGENNGAHFKNLTINCNSGIQMNSQTGGFTNDSTTQGYIMRPLIEDCIISANTTGSGTGVEWSKCMDGHIWRTEVMNFQYNIDLMGSDICSLKHNRLRGAGGAQVRVQSNQTFGSQTLIQHNDLLSLQSNATAFIMSSDHYLIVKDNYMEQVSGTGINSAIQLMTGSIVAIIHNNRVEVPSSYAPNWLNVQTALLCLDIKNNTTSGSAMGDALFPSGGASYWYNAFLRQKITHSGNTAGGLPFNSQSTFIPSGKNAFTLTSDLPGMTSANNGVNTLVASDGAFIIPVQANYGSMVTADPSVQTPGGVSGIISVKIVAKADVAGQTLYWQSLNGGSVVGTTSFSLTTGYVIYTLIVSTYYSNGITLKFWNNDTTHNGNVYIKKILIDYEKAEGTATIPASGTSVVVGHNMNYTPSIINVTAQGNVGNVWVSNINSTQFTINCSSAPASATTVSWRAD